MSILIRTGNLILDPDAGEYGYKTLDQENTLLSSLPG
jgi:hypothetical protein